VNLLLLSGHKKYAEYLLIRGDVPLPASSLECGTVCNARRETHRSWSCNNYLSTIWYLAYWRRCR